MYPPGKFPIELSRRPPSAQCSSLPRDASSGDGMAYLCLRHRCRPAVILVAADGALHVRAGQSVGAVPSIHMGAIDNKQVAY
jgi:hypothetical protein